jgi:hypothetical protein
LHKEIAREEGLYLKLPTTLTTAYSPNSFHKLWEVIGKASTGNVFGGVTLAS